MKKLIAIAVLSVATMLYADDFYESLKDTIDTVKTIKDTAEVVESINKASELGIWWLAEKNPNIFTSFVEAYPNTYIWYRFNDFKKATPLQQLEITKEINIITKE